MCVLLTRVGCWPCIAVCCLLFAARWLSSVACYVMLFVVCWLCLMRGVLVVRCFCLRVV